MSEALFVCCSGFQVFVALWLKHHYLQDVPADFFIDSFIKGYEDIALNIQKSGIARNVYYGNCVSSFYVPQTTGLKKIKSMAARFFSPKTQLEDAAHIKGDYSTIYIGCCDEPRRLLCSYLAKKQKSAPEIVLFDEGTGTYREGWRLAYHEWWHKKGIKGFISKVIYKDFSSGARLKDVYVFEPDNMTWKPLGKIKKIDRISIKDEEFREIANSVFSYYQCRDKYEEKYIYLGSIWAPEVEILNRIAAVVGKENIFVKRHPRERSEQFIEAGFKCNKDDSVIWEVIFLNIGCDPDKVFISIASSALINTQSVFDVKIKAFSLVDVIEKEHLLGGLNKRLWGVLYNSVIQHKEMLTICESFEDIKIGEKR